MNRRVLEPLLLASERKPAVTYQVWLTEEQRDQIKLAQESTGLSWPDWTEQAFARLAREDETEIRSLLSTWGADRKNKRIFSFRLYPETLTLAKKMADKHDRTVQAVFAHAHFMQALASGIKVIITDAS
jgi:hypothetical protein